MRQKRPVYNGYTEHYVTGKELKQLFEEKYLIYNKGRSSAVLGIKIPEYLDFIKIDDAKKYRIFLCPVTCKIMNADTDGAVDFFSHTSLDRVSLFSNLDNIHLERCCPECGAIMNLKRGRFGPFLGCSAYPVCKKTINIPTIGYYKPSVDQIEELFKYRNATIKIKQSNVKE